MCELLIRVKQSPHSRFGDPLASHRGDVIHVGHDGWPWGNMEYIHDFWRIVKLPNVPLEIGRVFEAGTPWQFRENKFALDHPWLSKEMREHLVTDQRMAGWFVEPTITTYGLETFIVRRPIRVPRYVALRRAA